MTSLLDVVPFARTLGITITQETPTVAIAALPDAEKLHNHIGGPHAGAMFTLGESASGAIVMAAFGDQLHRATPLTVSADIAYRKLALGTVTATATLSRPAEEVVAELDAGERPEFLVKIKITDAAAVLTGEMNVTWTLRPNR